MGFARALAIGLAIGAGCARAPRPNPDDDRAVVARYAELAYAGYRDAAAGARALEVAVLALVARPTRDTLEAARRVWREARVPYTRTEVFRFYDGPIDAVESRVNAWPIDESFIDYVEGAAASGMVNDTRGYPTLTAEAIESANEKLGEKNISTGYHAIEFLLWGQDGRADGPGDRPASDYANGSAAARRRGEYLVLAAGLLAGHLEAVADAWHPGSGAYRARFTAMPPRRAIGLMLKGAGTLTGPELAGERLTVAYETKDQENEHSCFSDNTSADIAGDVDGIRAVLLGRGGLVELVARSKPGPAARLTVELDASLAAARGLPPRFDQAILGHDGDAGRRAVKRLIDALLAQAATLGELAAVFDVRLGAGT